MPVRLSQNHQGAEKGLKTNKTQSSVWQLEPNSKARAPVGKGTGSLTLRGCAVPSTRRLLTSGDHEAPRTAWFVKPETAGSTVWVGLRRSFF